MDNEVAEGEVISSDSTCSKKRDEWEIKEDVRAIKKTIQIIKDPQRLKDAQAMMKLNAKTEESMQSFADGDLAKALGL